ncbi:MAG: SDR family oxidoreductase [Gemmatimonadales bacterium]
MTGKGERGRGKGEPDQLRGKTALVTGASRGIGLAIADALGDAGAHVVRLARSLTDGSADRRTDLRCDVTDPAQVERALGRVLAERGVPDVVVNNAGAFFLRPLADTAPQEFARALAVNVTAPFLVMRALLPHLARVGRGHIVTMGSIADHVAYPGNAAYAAGKFGLRGLHDVLRAELAGTGIRATLVSPGSVNTDMWDEVDPDATPGLTPRRRMLRVEDVAAAVLYAVTQPERVDVTEIRLMPAGRR